ncbi:hypothetical protein L9Z41_03500 [Leptospira noguchii]|uniref:hypothetical protein n=1 Tax=Leptospira noguchii TaxID=28182 RepID=UPI001F05FC9C|nr:hypothetical protein [Leptospira noguchii]MCH1911656.1 hypothetical protein [Leptospira noguchii]MCH1914739.1 hypothetical protein [Leptospira noguchii]UOG64667.1 hypothetical protein MAL04_03605 [Leptospira noguchii]
MKKKLTTKEILEKHKDSNEEKSLENTVIVKKSPFRKSNQAFFLGLFLLRFFPDQKISEGFGGVSVHGLFLTSGIVLMSWFKSCEILRSLGDFISKARGGGSS